MAAEERAKLDFIDILSRIDRKFDVIHVRWSEGKQFEAKFRTQIERNSEDFNSLCDKWVDMFSDVTRTVWVKKISNTGPKIRFRKQYQCWTQDGKEVHKELLFDARRCKGTLDMKVLTDNPLTRRKNKHIRMGLNVVVKINFNHLHPVNTKESYAFFVHTCEPQPEPPKPIIHSNDKLPQLVAEMVQKGLNSSKFSNHIKLADKAVHMAPIQIQHKIIAGPIEIEPRFADHISLQSLEQVQVNQVIPIQGMDNIKLQMQPQLQQLTQVVVTGPPLEMAEPLLMCQPTLMFDPTQVIPVTAHPISHHFVQVHSHNIHNQHGHYL